MGKMHYGVHRALEREADRLVRKSLENAKRPSDIDVMTEWKTADRRRREIKVASGTPDAAIRQGMFHRAANRTRLDLNARDGIARSSGNARGGVDSLSAYNGGATFSSGSVPLSEILGSDE